MSCRPTFVTIFFIVLTGLLANNTCRAQLLAGIDQAWNMDKHIPSPRPTKANLIIDSINAGPDTLFCSGVSYTMRALTPSLKQKGTWSNFPDNVLISDVNDPNAIVSNLDPGQAVNFVWTVTNGYTSRTDTIKVIVPARFNVKVDAGRDQYLASGTTSVQLNGNNPGSRVPFWTSLDGAQLSSTQQQNPIATIPSNGTYRFIYYILSPGCDINQDTVLVTVSAPGNKANAGVDQYVCISSLPASVTLTATSRVAADVKWIQVSGNIAQIAASNLPVTQVNNLGEGVYDFAFKITDDTCGVTADTVRVVVSREPGAVNAGSDQDLCNINSGATVRLNAIPVRNAAGVWTVVSTPGEQAPIFSDPDSPTSTVKNLQNGTTVLRWSSVSGPGCPVFADEVSLNVSVKANADATPFSACKVAPVTLTGNTNTKGLWAQVSGPGAAVLVNDNPNSAIASDLLKGTYIFRYSLPSLGSCPASQDDVTVAVYEIPANAKAGTDALLCPGLTSIDATANTPFAGAKKISGKDIVVYPNPVSKNVSTGIILNGYVYGASCNVYDNTGRTIYSTSLVDGNNQLKLPQSTVSGIYFIQVIDKRSGTSKVEKLVVE